MTQEAGGSSPLAHPTDNKTGIRLILTPVFFFHPISMLMAAYSKIDQPEILALLFPPAENVPSLCPDGAVDTPFSAGAEGDVTCRFYGIDRLAPILFYYPATTVSVAEFDAVAKQYNQEGMNVFLASYRGCGINSGSPSLASLYEDSRKIFPLAIDWLQDKGYTGALFIMGQSLGSLCAIDTVVENADVVKGMIIESGIGGTTPFLQALGVSEKQADIAEAEGFNNAEKMGRIKLPTLIFHGAQDKLVPIAEAEELQAASGARNKQFFVIPGAEHHRVGITGGVLFIRAIKQFTDTVCGVNTWREKRRKSSKRA